MLDKVVIIGASDKPERYSYKALQMLEQHNYPVFLVHPRITKIDGHKVYASLNELNLKINEIGIIDTITLYINPKLQEQIEEDLLTSKARRIIFNPGTENANLEEKLNNAGIQTERHVHLFCYLPINFR